MSRVYPLHRIHDEGYERRHQNPLSSALQLPKYVIRHLFHRIADLVGLRYHEELKNKQ